METTIDQIRAHYDWVNEQIAEAAAAVGRDPRSVRLLVVTKAQPVEKIQAAYQAGARLFGENYPEETAAKIEVMSDLPGIEWHMIGHLQSRKARIIAAHFDWLHSLDSISLAGKLDRALAEAGRVLPVLLEVNVSGEESKFGFPAWQEESWSELVSQFDRIAALEHLQIRGLMTMPPYNDDPERTRPYFARARRLRDFLAGRLPQAIWDELSMGTSVDFAVAIQEGATFVRVGTAIIGPRPPRE